MTKDENALIDFIDNFRNEFNKSTCRRYSDPRSVNGLLKYQSKDTIYRKQYANPCKRSFIIS